MVGSWLGFTAAVGKAQILDKELVCRPKYAVGKKPQLLVTITFQRAGLNKAVFPHSQKS